MGNDEHPSGEGRSTPTAADVVARDGAWWMRPWSGLTHCHRCNAIYPVTEPCPICGHQLDLSPAIMVIGGVEHVIPAATQGAFSWSTFVILRQMQAEWARPLSPVSDGPRPAQRLVIVILFWTLFEILMEQFYAAAFADLPGKIGEELLRRFPSIGGRLDRLYRLRWGVTFWEDLAVMGFADVARLLEAVQARRNAFVHGDPEAIKDADVEAAVENLARVQEAWIEVFNLRCTGHARNVPLWNANAQKLARTAD